MPDRLTMPCRLHQRLAAILLAGFAAVFLVCVQAAFSAPGNRAGDRPTRLEVWDLKLGTQLDALPDEFVDYACGTNGGPPAAPPHRRRGGPRRPAGERGGGGGDFLSYREAR